MIRNFAPHYCPHLLGAGIRYDYYTRMNGKSLSDRERERFVFYISIYRKMQKIGVFLNIFSVLWRLKVVGALMGALLEHWGY